MVARFNLTSQEIRDLLADATRADISSPYPEFPHLTSILSGEPRPASVLIPFLKIDDAWHILYTRRNANLPEHSGQVAFPGGRADPDDLDPVTTALRETWEEIGIIPEDVNVIGRLPCFLTITNYLVTPIVGQIPWPYPVRPAQEEVSRVFTIPLDWLADPVNHEERQRALPEPFGSISVIYFKEYDGEILWGASARFTLTLLNLLHLC
ncbi:MAG: CoA pyrophosphatase [Anaerolineales bacterium]|nr:CoA pyrophosphatase [Anaerolineales bacterium]